MRRVFVFGMTLFNLVAVGLSLGADFLGGESGQLYEILARRIDVDPLAGMKPAVYVVMFRVATLDDVPRLSRMAEDLSKKVEAEAERIPVERIAIWATKQDRLGPRNTESHYGFRFKKIDGKWVALDSKN